MSHDTYVYRAARLQVPLEFNAMADIKCSGCEATRHFEGPETSRGYAVNELDRLGWRGDGEGRAFCPSCVGSKKWEELKDLETGFRIEEPTSDSDPEADS